MVSTTKVNCRTVLEHDLVSFFWYIGFKKMNGFHLLTRKKKRKTLVTDVRYKRLERSRFASCHEAVYEQIPTNLEIHNRA